MSRRVGLVCLQPSHVFHRPLRPRLRLALAALPWLSPPQVKARCFASSATPACKKSEEFPGGARLREWSRLARAGDPHAMCLIGSCLLAGGQGVPRDIRRAERWLRRAAEGGEVTAMHLLGIACRTLTHSCSNSSSSDGNGDSNRNGKRCSDPAASDCGAAAGQEGEECAGRGEGELSEAVHWWLRAARAEDEGAMRRLGDLLSQGLEGAEGGGSGGGGGERHAKYVEEIVRVLGGLAQQGLAQQGLGAADGGQSGGEARGCAAALWARAAVQGEAVAQVRLGMLHLRGEWEEGSQGEGASSMQRGLAWLRMAARRGQPMALLQLGLCYFNGEGVAEDAEKAVRYLQLAAKDSGKGGKGGKGGGGHREAEWDEAVAEAQRVLGLCYFNGEGTVQDEGRAAALWGRAAGKGDAVAAGMLAHCFANGLGVAQDWRQAAKWYAVDAEQGGAVSQFMLGLCYQRGTGVPLDMRLAVKWMQRAACPLTDHPHHEAKQWLQDMQPIVEALVAVAEAKEDKEED